MTSWRDDLPPIPAEQIRTAATREGYRRRERRRERQRRAVTIGAVGAVVVAIVASGALTSPVPNGDDAASEATTAATGAAVATEAPDATDAASGTTEAAAEETTGAAATTMAEASATTFTDYTTLGDTEHNGLRPGLLPVSAAIRVDANQIWEAPASGPPCGPATLQVFYDRFDPIPDVPTLFWWAGGAVAGETPMTIGDEPTHAQATVGSFAPETLGPGVAHELVIYITTSGEAEVLRAPPVVLHDCG